MRVYDHPPVPADGGGVVPRHLQRGWLAEIKRDENPVSWVRPTTDLHGGEVYHHSLHTVSHGRGLVGVGDDDIAGPGSHVDVEVPPQLRSVHWNIIGTHLDSGETA